MSYLNPKDPNAPIPGANYTSNPQNWPWHRPPDITDMDEALDYIVKDLTGSQKGMEYMTLIETGFPITTITSMTILRAIGNGKFTVDYGVLLAGPIARIIEIMAKSYNIEYELGVEELPDMVTAKFYNEVASGRMKSAEMDEKDAEKDEERRKEIQAEVMDDMGLMSPDMDEKYLNEVEDNG